MSGISFYPATRDTQQPFFDFQKNTKILFHQKIPSTGFIPLLKDAPDMKKLKIKKFEDKTFLPNSVIRFFKTKYPGKLTHITIHTPDSKDNTHHYSKLMNVLSSAQLRCLKIDDDVLGDSPLSSEVLTQFMVHSPNLKEIAIHLKSRFSKEMTIPFNLCPHLEKVSLSLCPEMTEETFEELLKCEKLHTLTILNGWDKRGELRRRLVQPNQLSLKHLVSRMSPLFTTDYELHAITKQQPQLEVIGQNFSINEITDLGLNLLGYNCPNLTSFSFNFRNITEGGFIEFVKKVPNLQKLTIYEGTHFDMGTFQKLGKHCPNLKSIELMDEEDWCETKLAAIALYIKNLKFIKINGKVKLNTIKTCVKEAKKLKAFKLNFDEVYYKKEVEEEFPHLNWNPDPGYSKSIQLDPLKNRKKISPPPLSEDQLKAFLSEAIEYERWDDVQTYSLALETRVE